MPRVIVKLTNCRYSYRGRAHWIEYEHSKENYGSSVRWHRILVRIGAPANFPKQVRYPRFKSDMPQYECRTYREAVVMVTAHEIEHCLGASGRMNGEFRCEMAAWDAIDYYRKHQPEVDQEITGALNRITQREQTQALRLTEAKRPEVQIIKKLKAAQEALMRWQRKQKLATGKVKKYSRAVKRYEKKIQESVPLEGLLVLAAKTA